jgi:hypothetical protein
MTQEERLAAHARRRATASSSSLPMPPPLSSRKRQQHHPRGAAAARPVGRDTRSACVGSEHGDLAIGAARALAATATERPGAAPSRGRRRCCCCRGSRRRRGSSRRLAVAYLPACCTAASRNQLHIPCARLGRLVRARARRRLLPQHGRQRGAAHPATEMGATAAASFSRGLGSLSLAACGRVFKSAGDASGLARTRRWFVGGGGGGTESAQKAPSLVASALGRWARPLSLSPSLSSAPETKHRGGAL